MRKFRFRLKSLENLKGMERDALRQELAVAQEELRKAEQQLLGARDALDAAYNELAELRVAQVDSTILLSLESYTGILRDQIRAHAQRVAELRHSIEEARERLAEKHKEKRVLEKYREQKYTQHSRHVEREEQKELDEVAKNLHHRDQAEQ